MTPDKKKAKKRKKPDGGTSKVTVEEAVEMEDEAAEAAKEAAEELDKREEESVDEDVVVGDIIDGRWSVKIDGVGTIGFRHLKRNEDVGADICYTKEVHRLKNEEGIPSIADLAVDIGGVNEGDIESIRDSISEGESVEDIVDKLKTNVSVMRMMKLSAISAEVMAEPVRTDYYLWKAVELLDPDSGEWSPLWKSMEDVGESEDHISSKIIGHYSEFRRRPVGFTSGSSTDPEDGKS